ncbi:MAG: phenylalanine--tRNA ligase subunit alpha [Candidatus Omnitrophica bacterium]|nr:phenylalanine--tRNA ligase subunit alpha [Candidatus Omnitrophota bacterium]MDD5236681.1 phenylalanine--tRNA ligase subunit alpha [Candidatus Omnitrophota bacterium]MDD5610709.1 phenylalanine--tRNA ligase subunit alpha [Candidatus Omnitrophota bacterium]
MSTSDIASIKTEVAQAISAATGKDELEALRIKYLGRKGLLAEMTQSFATLPAEEKPQFGRAINELKAYLVGLFAEKQKSLESSGKEEKNAFVDIGMPGIAQEIGRMHPLTQVIREICEIFSRLGFLVVEGPEIETEENNFTGLNIPLEHPSRDAFDTFYLKNQKLLLRSHTSPVQIRAMKSRKPPLAIVVPGRVYRPDALDASHSFMFHQIEGFMVDKNIKFSDLKGVLEAFAKSVFGDQIKMRLRPHFFPFTEPSAEVDISCIICKGKGCSVCGRKGWLEVLGSGMIHPNVFKHVGYDPEKYTGFAFGMGVERIAMLKYGINDIRLFYENDLRFLKQF